MSRDFETDPDKTVRLGVMRRKLFPVVNVINGDVDSFPLEGGIGPDRKARAKFMKFKCLQDLVGEGNIRSGFAFYGEADHSNTEDYKNSGIEGQTCLYVKEGVLKSMRMPIREVRSLAYTAFMAIDGRFFVDNGTFPVIGSEVSETA